jgi:hypothetical protein
MQPSRRAFLLGRRPPRTPWQTFCDRLRRLCGGELARIPEDGSASEGAPPQARWTPLNDVDVRQARILCAEHAVVLALAGSRIRAEDRPVLWVDPVRLDRLAPEPGGPRAAWRAGPGVRLGELVRAGLYQFAGDDPGRTLAAWFADRRAAAWPSGRGDLSGVQAADVLLADGAAGALGPFGAADGEPLRGAALQRLVPALFSLASQPEAQWCRGQSGWPAHYRLDALLPADPARLNLAQLLHGHGGTLAWVESLVLEAQEEGHAARTGPACAAEPSTGADSMPAQARAVDARVKFNFDPAGVFPELPTPGAAGMAAPPARPPGATE